MLYDKSHERKIEKFLNCSRGKEEKVSQTILIHFLKKRKNLIGDPFLS